jgi:hypothetical protein
MTRRGNTPFLQATFKSVLIVYAAKPDPGAEWEEVGRKAAGDDSWDDWRFVYGDLVGQGYERVRLSVASSGPTGLEPYLVSSSDDSGLVFGFLVVSSEIRRREFVRADLMHDQSGKVMIASGNVDFALSELRGEVLVEPMVVASSFLKGAKGWEGVDAGTILGTTNLVRLREHASLGFLGDIFEFTWISFGADTDRSAGEMFDIDLLAPGDRPVLYLNEDIENFHNLLNEQDKPTGRPTAKVKSRRAMDVTLAVQIVTQCLAAIAQRISFIASLRRLEDPEDTDFGSIFDELTTHERTIAEGWRHLLGVRHDHKNGESVCAEIASLGDLALLSHISGAMPRYVRAQVDVESAATYIIDGGLKPEPEGGEE